MSLASPQFSVLLAADADSIEPDLTSASIASVSAQSFTDWELIVCGVRIAEQTDRRLRVLDGACGADAATLRNQAITAALGTFLVVFEPGDTLPKDALARLARALDAAPDVDVLYADVDVSAADGAAGREVIRKPAWSPERLRHGDYIGAFRAMRTALVREVGGYRGGTTMEYDLTLRVTERARDVAHLPGVLCHRARRPALVADKGARAAVQDQLDRRGIAGTVSPGPLPGYHRVTRTLDPDVRVSVIVPTRGQTGEVAGETRYFVVEAVRTALAKTEHRDVEVVVVYDEPTPPGALAQLREIAGDRLVLLPYGEPFNFSEKCNLGFLRASGDVVVLLNDDTEVISDNWLEALVAPLAEPDVGMTGAKLYYADGTIQHGGHLYASVGRRPFPWHAYRWSDEAPGEFASLVLTRECSGVTAACAALRREVYEQVGGLSESLPGNYNDVDLSLKVRHAGLRVLWVADCELYHFESQSRTPNVSPFEFEFLAKRWPDSFQRDLYLPWLRIEEARKRPVRK
ncbi:MAG: glycosyltransferase [Jatrophihabitans sp.]